MLANDILLSTMYESWGVEPKDDGLLYKKKTGKIANGEFNSFYHSWGFFKTDKLYITAIMNDGDIVELTRYDKQGNIESHWKKD
jgi:hypothetical protein|tara:strand:+ start:1054 stop:1305 length:252 start_codon:yes stop_codon:yes gene_type:complete